MKYKKILWHSVPGLCHFSNICETSSLFLDLMSEHTINYRLTQKIMLKKKKLFEYLSGAQYNWWFMYSA